jgi:signal transduction histidine kinase
LNGIREQERARMARDIHDHLGQSLTALKMDVAEVRRRLKAADADAVEERLTEMSVLIDESVNDIRRVAAELRPPILDGLGVVAAIRAYLQDFSRRVNVPCVLTTDLFEVTLADDRAIALFRILQEALTNVGRHAAAGRIDVALRADSAMVHLTVHDDGRGIPAEETRDPRALGLVGMRDRARLFGGDVAVSGRPGQGTTVTAFVPLAETTV